MGKLTGLSIQREDILAPKALIREKLKRAQGYFYDRRFDLAERECQEALLLDPNNYLGWVRLGSALFALGDMDRAREAYERALEIRPEDASVKEFMRMQGWK